MAQRLLLSTLPLLLFFGGVAQAGIIFNNGMGTTVYGATNYGAPTAPGSGPQFIPNNVTGNNDILSTPGNGWQTANPVVQNNVAETLGPGYNTPTPYFFNWVDTTNGNGFTFGAGTTTVTGPSMVFGLNDTTVGCCTASYMITSTDTNYTVDANGYNGSLGAYLAIGGINLTGNDASAASLIVDYSINGGAFVPMPEMVLGVNGNCSDDVSIGGFTGNTAAEMNAGCGNGGNGGAFSALSIDNLGNFAFAPGTTIQVIATLTAYSDPSSIDSISPDIDLSLLPGVSLPGFDLASAGAPEPGTLFLIGAGLAGLGLIRRRKA